MIPLRITFILLLLAYIVYAALENIGYTVNFIIFIGLYVSYKSLVNIHQNKSK